MKLLKTTIFAVWLAASAIVVSMPRVVMSSDEPSGKDLFKQDCRVCHEKDSPNGEYSPLSLTQDQWRAFFKNKFEATHKDVVLEKEKKKLLEVLTPKNIEAIKKFAIDHAADSEQPQTCSD